MRTRRFVRLRRWSSGVLAAGSALVLAVGLSLFAARAVAVVEEFNAATPGGLSLVMEGVGEVSEDLSAPIYWQVSAAMTGDRLGTLTLELRKDGPLSRNARGLVVTIDRCSERWEPTDAAPSCGLEQQRVLVATPREDYSTSSPTFDLQGITDVRGKFLLVALTLDQGSNPDIAELLTLSATISIGLTAANDSPPIGEGAPTDDRGHLALTGVDVLALTLVAVGALALGVTITAARRRRESNGDGGDAA